MLCRSYLVHFLEAGQVAEYSSSGRSGLESWTDVSIWASFISSVVFRDAQLQNFNQSANRPRFEAPAMACLLMSKAGHHYAHHRVSVAGCSALKDNWDVWTPNCEVYTMTRSAVFAFGWSQGVGADCARSVIRGAVDARSNPLMTGWAPRGTESVLADRVQLAPLQDRFLTPASPSFRL